MWLYEGAKGQSSLIEADSNWFATESQLSNTPSDSCKGKVP